MLSSGIIDLAIGLIFVFGVTAALSSVLTELIARFLGLRAGYLLTGLRELLDDGDMSVSLGEVETAYTVMQDMVRGAKVPQPPSATSALLGGPILGSQGMAGQISSRNITLTPTGTKGRLAKMTADRKDRSLRNLWGLRNRWSLWDQRRNLPSYISSASFAEAVIDLVVPDQAGQTTMGVIEQTVEGLPPSPFRHSLQALIKNAGDDVSQFRAAVERWYDDHMDRVSGWYKRHVANITLVVGALLVVLLNINTLTIGRTLYNNSTIRTALSTVAASNFDCPASPARQTCLEDLQAQLSVAAQSGLPIGWTKVSDCAAPSTSCNWLDQRGIFSRHGGSGWQFVLVLIGFLITITALVPGARFWFDLLARLGSLRTTGPKPSESPAN